VTDAVSKPSALLQFEQNEPKIQRVEFSGRHVDPRVRS
jgi:hypothetical protein